MEKTREEIEKEIIEYLDEMSTRKGTPGKGCGLKHGSALVLATCKDNQPRATTLDFFNEGLTLYIFGEPGGKIANIRANPNVSAVVYQPVDHSKTQRYLQIWGKASLINRKNNKELFEEKVEKWGLYDVAKVLMKGNLKKNGVAENQLDDQVNKTVDKALSGMHIIKIEPEKIIMRIFTPDFTGDKHTWTKE